MARSFRDVDDGTSGFFPGERIGSPLSVRGLGPIVKAWLLILALVGAAWVPLGGDLQWLQGLWARVALTPAATQATPEPRKETDRLPAVSEEQAEASAMRAGVPDGEGSALASVEKEAAPVAATVPYDQPVENGAPAAPLEPPVADSNDPLQKQALSVGLHPGLSNALLSRLSPADYRNAGKAIDTAVAETPDDGVLVWPRQRMPGLALFQVHFVQGAAPSCRRYVVTVSKDGWSTTALPMERCGSRASARSG